ncbi:hypothetical protein [Nonomuraea sp. NPDC049158]|uniref:hypothetical protein n=1 Tax=Nonomuraea sp. NPDC049158 TaxID=3155649 RepID=UPI0033DB54CA
MEPYRNPKPRAKAKDPFAAAKAAADALIGWIGGQPFSADNNFTVAVMSATVLVVSKVGGLSAGGRRSKDGPGQKIMDHLKGNRAYRGYQVYAAGPFTPDNQSNHAEMCILAACGVRNVKYIRCTSANCGFCKDALEAYGLRDVNANAKSKIEGASQVAWCDPFMPVAYGTAVKENALDAQRKELKKIIKMAADGTRVTALDIKEGKYLVSRPKAGNLTLMDPNVKARNAAADSTAEKTGKIRKMAKPLTVSDDEVPFTANKRRKLVSAPSSDDSGDDSERARDSDMSSDSGDEEGAEDRELSSSEDGESSDESSGKEEKVPLKRASPHKKAAARKKTANRKKVAKRRKSSHI